MLTCTEKTKEKIQAITAILVMQVPTLSLLSGGSFVYAQQKHLDADRIDIRFLLLADLFLRGVTCNQLSTLHAAWLSADGVRLYGLLYLPVQLLHKHNQLLHASALRRFERI